MKKHLFFNYLTGIIILSGFLSQGCSEPEEVPFSPSYKYFRAGSEQGSSGERGNMLINEINFAGSVKNDGTYDPDDVFIELWNKHPRPLNLSGWRIEVHGDYNYAFRIPPNKKTVYPNGFFVIAAKSDGAFGDAADVIVPQLRLGKHITNISLRDIDRKRIESGGAETQRVFAGGYDDYSVRSMERSQIIFGNRGNQARNWHAFSKNFGSNSIKKEWRNRTLASPGGPNSPDYSGNEAIGNFE